VAVELAMYELECIFK